MLAAQLSDPHVRAGRAPAFPGADTALALERAVAHLNGLSPAPDALVVTGDLADRGEAGAYGAVREILEGAAFPAYAVPGNHDHKGALLGALGAFCPAEPALLPEICYAVRLGPVLAVMLDTASEGVHSGGASGRACDWLARTLAAEGGAPALVFCHHPPFPSGMGRMDAPFRNADGLAEAIRVNPRAVLCCGHLHRGLAASWRGVRAAVAPPVSLGMVLDLTPEGGDDFVLGAPGYLLHHLSGGELVTHFCTVPGDWPASGPYSFSDQRAAE
jgi:3',5'-cyclic AMP phosphodiesterase CpdA